MPIIENPLDCSLPLSWCPSSAYWTDKKTISILKGLSPILLWSGAYCEFTPKSERETVEKWWAESFQWSSLKHSGMSVDSFGTYVKQQLLLQLVTYIGVSHIIDLWIFKWANFLSFVIILSFGRGPQEAKLSSVIIHYQAQTSCGIPSSPATSIINTIQSNSFREFFCNSFVC